jgi:23S rRNA (cytosine1962-C5)-methyltransferase
MSLPLITLKRGSIARVLTGHPWVFGNELEEPVPSQYKGQLAALEDHRKRFLGVGIVNPDSQIVWRRVSREPVVNEAQLWEKRLADAIDKRGRMYHLDKSFHRLVWSESDELPGLVVDRYEDTLVVQLLTAAMDQRKDWIAQWLQSRFAGAEIVFRQDNPIREKEGLPIVQPQVDGVRWLQMSDLQWAFPLGGGQKTGFFLDQLLQQRHVANMYAKGARVLDLFSHTGGFAIRAMHAGARSVTAVEISAEAVTLGKEICSKNHLTVNWVEGNVFDYLSEPTEERFDLIVLDPPNFCKSAQALPGAIRGYKECHLRAMNLLAPGGVLATYCCSHHMNRSLFEQTIRDAAGDAGVSLEILEEVSQSPDHPRYLEMPESEYFKGVIYRLAGRFPKPLPRTNKRFSR